MSYSVDLIQGVVDLVLTEKASWKKASKVFKVH